MDTNQNFNQAANISPSNSDGQLGNIPAIVGQVIQAFPPNSLFEGQQENLN